LLPSLLDDLNTPAALAALSAPLKAINDLLSTKAGRKAADRLQQLARHQAAIASGLQLLGLARAAARAAKDFAAADAIRIELAQQGVAIMDLPDGSTTWRPVQVGP
ncbi:uncharacterized protein HaLaN_28194, partial [Haematococcus lacustris]